MLNELIEVKTCLDELVAQERRKAQTVLSSMVSAFRANQSAWRMRRVSIDKTGVIDPIKLSQYKLTDDIFLRRAIVPKGQNHGMVVHVDWSQSMDGVLPTVIFQVLHLIWFCETLNIPLEVYGFTTQSTGRDNSYILTLYRTSDPVQVRKDMQTLMFATAVQTSKVAYDYGSSSWTFDPTYTTAPKGLHDALNAIVARKFTLHQLKSIIDHPSMRRGGTPLFSAIYSSIHTVREFRERYRVQQCSSVWLTDGADASGLKIGDNARINTYTKEVRIIDPISGKTFETSDNTAMAALFAMHRELTGSTVICIDMNDTPSNSLVRVLTADDVMSVMTDIGIEGKVSIPGYRTRKVPTRKQTKKSLVFSTQMGTFAETGMAIVSRENYPALGADVYIVTHPSWWTSSETMEKARIEAAERRRSKLAADIEYDRQLRQKYGFGDDDAEFDDDDDNDDYLDAEDAMMYNRVNVSATLLNQSAQVSMRKFTDMLIPYIASGK